MALCKSIQATTRTVCLGDMDRVIKIYSRNIQTPLSNVMEHSQEYRLKASPWALVKTLNGIATFDGVEISGIRAYEIFIRYNSTITSEDFVQIEGRNIKIDSVEDLDLKHEFMRLVCIDKGDRLQEATL